MLLRVALLASLAASALAIPAPLNPTRRPFEGESIIRAKLDTIEKHGLVEGLNLDVWKELPNGVADIRVDAIALSILNAAGIEYEVYIDSVADLVEAASARRANYKGTRDVYFEEYHTYPEQVAYYQDLCSANSHKCSRLAVGTSYLGNTQYEYTIRVGNPTKAIFMDAGIHAREWISSTTLQYVFTKLIESNDTSINQFAWIIHGHQNPDGYIYSWSSDANRLWRKSRNVNQGSACVGTDLNRNWPTPTWSGPGSSANPCSDTYHGSGAGSEPEVRNLIPRFVNAYNTYEVPVAISFHSYSQLLLRQYGHTPTDCPDENAERTLGALMVAAIDDNSGLTYENIKSIELYATTGTTGDWYYDNSTATSYGTATFGYTYELRDTGRYGFELPENQIIPQGEEIWASILAMVDWLL